MYLPIENEEKQGERKRGYRDQYKHNIDIANKTSSEWNNKL